MFFKSKKNAAPVKADTTPQSVRAVNSAYNTDLDVHEPMMVRKDGAEIMRRPIQRTIKDFKPVDTDGTVLDDKVTSAMDAITTGDPWGDTGNVGAFKQNIDAFNPIPWIQLEWFANHTFFGYNALTYIAQHWLVYKACNLPGRDAMRHGYEITVNSGDKLSPEMKAKIRRLDKKYKTKANAVKLACFNRIFGVRVLLFKVNSNDEKYYEKPFNIDGVKKGSYQGIVQVDPYWVTPELDSDSASDPSSLHFYEPTWWRISGKRYHRSHLIVLRHGELGDILKPTYLFGGISIPQQIAQRVFAAERVANEAPQLAATKRLNVIHTDMVKAFANQAAFQQKMGFFSAMRDNYGIKAVGLDDSVEQFDISLTDVDTTIMTQYQLVAAIACVPATKLIETTPKGFGATGQYDADSYHETLESVQEHELDPFLERHYMILNRSEELGLEDIDITWNPVDSPTGQELATINLTKAQTGAALVASGAIDGVDERDRIIQEDDSGYSGIKPISADLLDEDTDDGDQENSVAGKEDKQSNSGKAA